MKAPFFKQWEFCLRAGALPGETWYHVLHHVWQQLRRIEDPLRHLESKRFLAYLTSTLETEIAEERARRVIRNRAYDYFYYVESMRIAPAVVGELVDCVTAKFLPSMFGWTCTLTPRGLLSCPRACVFLR